VRVEGEEVGALAPGDVDDLDVLAFLHLVVERRGLVDAEVEPRLGQRLGQLGLLAVGTSARCTSTTSAEAGQAPSTTRPAGRGDDDGRVARAVNCSRAPGRPSARTAGSRAHRPAPARAREHARRRVRPHAERLGVGADDQHLGRLAAVGVDHREAVSRAHRHRVAPPGRTHQTRRPGRRA
jgi:hypothetical protein